MGKDKRYVVALDFYLWARNDREAMVESSKIAEFLRTLEDNHAQVLSVHENCREVHKGRLTLFENKLIER